MLRDPAVGEPGAGTAVHGSTLCHHLAFPSLQGSSKPDPQGCLLAHLPKLGQRRCTDRSARQGEGQRRGDGTGHALCTTPTHATPGLRQGSSCTSADGSHCQQRPSPGGTPLPTLGCSTSCARRARPSPHTFSLRNVRLFRSAHPSLTCEQREVMALWRRNLYFTSISLSVEQTIKHSPLKMKLNGTNSTFRLL